MKRLSPLPVRERMKVRVRIQRYARVRILPNVEIERVVESVQSRIAVGLLNCAKNILRLSPLPVRERMKVRVRIQRYARVRILPNVEIEKVVGSVQSRIAGRLLNCAKNFLCVVAGLRSREKHEDRILNRAGRCKRT